MKMNWKEESEKGGSYEIYPSGGYILSVKDWEKTTASTGTAQLRFHFTILQPTGYASKTYVDHFALTPKALWRLASFIAACGIDTSTLGEMEVGTPSFVNVLKSAKGRQVGAVISMGTFNNKDRNNVDEYTLVEKTVINVEESDEEVPDFLKGANEDTETLI